MKKGLVFMLLSAFTLSYSCEAKAQKVNVISVSQERPEAEELPE